MRHEESAGYFRGDSKLTSRLMTNIVIRQVTSWDEGKGDVDYNYEDGRSYISAVSEVIHDESETCDGAAKVSERQQATGNRLDTSCRPPIGPLCLPCLLCLLPVISLCERCRCTNVRGQCQAVTDVENSAAGASSRSTSIRKDMMPCTSCARVWNNELWSPSHL